MLKKRKGLLSVAVFIMILQLCGCGFGVLESIETENIDPATLQALAYTEKKEESQYTVMIKEYNEYVPYLVLTDDYDGSGNCLLLRKYLLDETHRFNENGDCAAYYGYSELDDYLNKDIFKTYTKELQDVMVDSQVEITTRKSIDDYETITEHITRKIFILSYNELGYGKSDVRPAEGDVIEYFNSDKRRIATFEDGKARAWWLRTPDIMNDVLVTCVAADGMFFVNGISGPGFDYEMCVRPAFCLPRDTAIIEVDGVNYIEADYNALDVMHNAEDRTAMLYEYVPATNLLDAVEKVPDKYRPEGYHVNIRNALAFQMKEHKTDEEYKYHVMIYSVYEIDLEEILFEINSNVDNNLFFDIEYWRYMECTDGMEKYYYALTAAEINELVQHKIICAYVGSGEGSLDKANWDTTEGILEYCEIYGDGYVAK